MHLAISHMLAETDCDVGNDVGWSGSLCIVSLLEDLFPHQSLPEALRRRRYYSASMAYAAGPFDYLTAYQARYVPSPSLKRRRRISSASSDRSCNERTFLDRPVDNQAVISALLPKAWSACNWTKKDMVAYHCPHIRYGFGLSGDSLVGMSPRDRWKIEWYANVLLVSARLLIPSREMYWEPCDRVEESRPASRNRPRYRNGRPE